MEKQCNKCNTIKDIFDFELRENVKGGHYRMPKCSECMEETRKKRRDTTGQDYIDMLYENAKNNT